MRYRRRGFSLVEMVIVTLLAAMLFALVYDFFIGGQRILTSTGRKVSAIGSTHRRFEDLRQRLECCQWAWTPGPGQGKEGALGSPILYVDATEYDFDPGQGTLFVATEPQPGRLRDLRFSGGDAFLRKFAISSGSTGATPTGKPAFRECSTLVSKVYLEAQAEEVRERNHVYESRHHWAVKGPPVHYGFRR